MAAGVPVASYDCASGPREIIEHEVNGLLVSPESMAGMARALLRLATDDDLRRTLGEGAFRTSRQYDAFAIAERWVGIFTAAARGARRRPARPAGHGPGRGQPVPTAAAEAVAADGVTPAQARQEALRGPSRRPPRAATTGWSSRRTSRASPVVVVPMADRDAFLKALGDPGAPAYLSLRDPEGARLARAPRHDRRLGEDLRRGMTPRLVLEPWPVVDEQRSVLGQGCTVEVQFWERAVDGDLVAPRPNPYADRIPAGEGRATGIEGVDVPTLPLMAAPTVGECRFPVDVVYTWVDGGDPAWDAAREARISGMEGTAQTREASGRARFSPATSCATRCAACTCSRRGSARSTWSPPAGPAWLDARPPRRRRRPTRDPAGRRAADLQLARDRDLAAPRPRAGRALRLLQRRHLPRPAAAPRDVLRPAGLRRCSSPQSPSGSTDRPTPAVPQGRAEQPPAAAGRVRRRHHQRPGARAVRRRVSVLPRSRSGSPTWSTRPPARRSAPTPTSRR